jgi:hypothetical protein
MRNSSTKTCYIRAGTYSGGGNGYTTQDLVGGGQASLLLTSADSGTSGNPTLFAEYPPDIPSNAVSTAIFDGGASTWSGTGGGVTSCPTGNPPLSALTDGIWIVGASYVTIDHLMFQNYCWTGIMVQGAWTGGGSWGTDCESINNGTTSDHVVISNNVVHNIANSTSCSNGGLEGYRAGISSRFSNTNLTITHNLVYNVQGKAIDTVINPCSAGDSSQTNSGLSIDHNLIYNANAAGNAAYYGSDDSGVIYSWDCAQNNTATKTFSYNYIMSFGLKGQAITGNTGMYDDDGTSAIARFGNIVKGPGQICFFAHSPASSADYGNICDIADVSSLQTTAWYTGASSCSGTGPTPCTIPYAASWTRNLVIGKTTNGGGCPNTTGCALFINWYVAGNTGNPTYPGTGSNNNDYYNYGSGGSTLIQTWAKSACCGGAPGSDTNAQAIAPGFSCPGGNVDSWSYTLTGTSPLFSAPTNFPAQPAGWGTPGFWGPQLSTWTSSNPQGYSIGTNHFGDTPSYIGSGVNGC